MIGFFPETLYPDELLYSLLCRYHVRTGYLYYVATAEDLYSKKTVHPDIEFLNKFNDDALSWITKIKPLEHIILNHTMFPLHARFLSVEKKRAAYTALMSMDGNWRNLLSIPYDSRGRFLKYCPLCAAEDREKYGETYWHRQHQIPKIRVCPKHKCFLCDSTIQISGRNSVGFYSAEQIIPCKSETIYCDNEVENGLTRYITNVINSPLNIESDINVGILLHNNLPDKYINQSGLVRNIKKIKDDFDLFYGSILVATEAQLQKVFNGYKHDFYLVCQLAYFEGIPEDYLTNVNNEIELTGIEKLYQELSLKHNVDINTIKIIGDEILKFVRKSSVQKSCGPRAKKIEALDIKMLPVIKNYITDFYDNDNRPKKLSFSTIQKNLNLPQKQLYKMERCRAYISEHLETQEQFWAREVEWAVKTLKPENVTWTKINRLLNIKKVDLKRCKPYIAENEALETIENLLKGFN